MSKRNVLTSLVALLSSSRGLVGYGWSSATRSVRISRKCGFVPCTSRYLHTEAHSGWARQGVYAKALKNDLGSDVSDNPRERARVAFSKLSKKGRSWRRLRHLVDLACLCNIQQVRSIADVGCDHGLVSLALAVSGRFDHVVGVDVSEAALNKGAIALFDRIRHNLRSGEAREDLSSKELQQLFPVDFAVGDGLRVLKPNQADAICIAGMGVDTMVRILDPTEVDRVGSKALVLQPTNTRPRNLIRLYDFLAETGWTIAAERIEYLSSRWYISSLFARDSDASSTLNASEEILPGRLLALSENESTNKANNAYVEHHRQWIEQDALNPRGRMDENDRRWLEAVKEQDKGMP